MSVMSLLDLDLVFWNQMLMRSMHHNIYTYTCTIDRSAMQLPRAFIRAIGNMLLVNLGFYTHKRISLKIIHK